MLTVLVILTLVAFGCAIASAMGKCPLWVSVMLVCVVLMIQCLPLGR